MNSREIGRINESYHRGDKPQKRIITRRNYTYRTLVELLDKYIKGKNNILDLGSGVGTLDFYLASKGNHVVGVDQSKIAINMAIKNARLLGVEKNIAYFQKDILKFESKEKFDAVILFEVIEHLPDDSKAIIKAKELLKRNGLIFISTRASNAPLTRIGLTKKHDIRVGHLRRYTLEGLVKIILNAGLKSIYKSKSDGFSKELLFSFPFGAPFIRVANRFEIVSDVLTFFDKMLMKLFGESQVIIVARKI